MNFTKKQIIVLIITFMMIPILFVSTVWFYDFITVDTVLNLPMDVEFTPMDLTFNVTKSALDFGKIPLAAGYAERKIFVNNTQDYPLYTEFKVDGSIVQFVHIAAPVRIEPNTEGTIIVRVSTKPAVLGIYDGTFTLTLRRKIF